MLSDGDGNPHYHIDSSAIHYPYRGTSSANADVVKFLSNVGGIRNTVCQIQGDGDIQNVNNSYGSISDKTLKENIVDASSQWEDLKSVQVRKYSMIRDELDAPNQIGVIAQELEESGMSGLVQENEDGVKSVKYSILYMKAIKALQEAMTRIETLETEVDKLKG